MALNSDPLAMNGSYLLGFFHNMVYFSFFSFMLIICVYLTCFLHWSNSAFAYDSSITHRLLTQQSLVWKQSCIKATEDSLNATCHLWGYDNKGIPNPEKATHVEIVDGGNRWWCQAQGNPGQNGKAANFHQGAPDLVRCIAHPPNSSEHSLGIGTTLSLHSALDVAPIPFLASDVALPPCSASDVTPHPCFLEYVTPPLATQ